MNKDGRFEFIAPFATCYKDAEGRMHVVAIASDNLPDVQDDRMSNKCITSMVKQAKNNSLPLLDHHRATFGYGATADAEVVQDGPKREFKVDFILDGRYPQAHDLYAEVHAKKCDKQLSIGGVLDLDDPDAVTWEPTADGYMRRVINAVILDHIAMTRSGMAANPRTGFLHAMFKSLEGLDQAGFQVLIKEHATAKAARVEKVHTPDCIAEQGITDPPATKPEAPTPGSDAGEDSDLAKSAAKAAAAGVEFLTEIGRTVLKNKDPKKGSAGADTVAKGNGEAASSQEGSKGQPAAEAKPEANPAVVAKADEGKPAEQPAPAVDKAADPAVDAGATQGEDITKSVNLLLEKAKSDPAIRELLKASFGEFLVTEAAKADGKDKSEPAPETKKDEEPPANTEKAGDSAPQNDNPVDGIAKAVSDAVAPLSARIDEMMQKGLESFNALSDRVSKLEAKAEELAEKAKALDESRAEKGKLDELTQSVAGLSEDVKKAKDDMGGRLQTLEKVSGVPQAIKPDAGTDDALSNAGGSVTKDNSEKKPSKGGIFKGILGDALQQAAGKNGGQQAGPKSR